MRSRMRGGAIALLLAVPVTAGAPARAAEPDFFDPFDASVFGYVATVSNVQIEFAPEVGHAAAGSARIVNTRSDSLSGPVDWMLDCFSADAGTDYTAAAWILLPEGQTATGQATVMVTWYASVSCSQATFLSFGRTYEIRNPGSDWQLTEEPLTAPPGALGARIGMTVFKNESTGSLVAYFDELRFAPEPSTAAAGVAALLALALLGKPRGRAGRVRWRHCGSSARRQLE
jgi:hypothetical protein